MREVGKRAGLFIAAHLPTGSLTHKAFLHGHIDAAPTLVLASHPVPTLGTSPDHVTKHASIFTNAVNHDIGVEDKLVLPEAAQQVAEAYLH